MRRALLFCTALALAVACGDTVTEPVSSRNTTPPVSFATSSSEDGLSITTDKDDYAPGDTVWFTGAGWAANDVLDIQLEDDPATHAPHFWTVNVAEDGTFRDSTYVVDVDDVGVTFTLTATSRTTLRSLVVVFTDGTISNGSVQMRDGSTCTTAQSSVSSGSAICAHASFTISGSGGTKAQFRWKSPTGAIEHISQKSPDFPNGTSGAQTYSATYAPSEAGLWTVLLCESDNSDASLARCAGSTMANPLGATHRASQTFTVTAGPTKLAFTSGAFTGVVGECLGAITVETQNASNVATNVTSNTTVNLATDGTGAFYSDNACTTTPVSSVSILTGNNSASFYYKATARGDGTHLLTASATGLTSATQTQTINKAATSTALSSSPNPSILNQSVTFTATVTVNSPGSGTPTGNVAFIEGGTCGAPTATHATVPLSGGQASFNISTLGVGSHTVVACYPEGTDFLASQGTVTHLVKYNFDGLFAPVDRPSTLNLSKAGQSIPLKWRITDVNLQPITNLTDVSVKVTAFSCALGSTTDLVEEYAAGASGLQNLGDGYYLFAWKTPTGYASSCKTLSLDFGSGYVEAGLANFSFKK